MLKTALMSATAALALAAAGPALAQEVPGQEPVTTEAIQDAEVQEAEVLSVTEALRQDGRFTILLSALDQAELSAVLDSQQAVSIFAPTDEAFAALPEEERTRLLDPANAGELRERLLHHVIIADVSSDQIMGARGGVPTAAQTQVLLDGTGESITIDGATVVQADIDTANGAIFAIDRVLDPSTSQAAMGDTEAVEPVEATPPTLPDEQPPVDEPTEQVDEPLPPQPE